MSSLFQKHRPIGIATVTIIVGTIIRVLQKQFLIYPRTGFLTTMEWTYWLLLGIMLLGSGLVYWGMNKENLPQLTEISCPPLGIMALFSAVAVLLDTVAWYIDPPYLDPLILISPLLTIATTVMGVLAALSFLKLARDYHKGAGFAQGNWILVALPLWQSGRTVLHFAYYRQVTTLSDNLLETLFMVLCCLFLMNHVFICVGISRSSHSTLWTGLVMGIVSIPLVGGQLVTFVSKPSLYGPSLPSCIWMFTISLYSIVFIDRLLQNKALTEE